MANKTLFQTLRGALVPAATVRNVNIGGFSDNVFDLIAAFAAGPMEPITGSARSKTNH